jgi:hypothetical protein
MSFSTEYQNQSARHLMTWIYLAIDMSIFPPQGKSSYSTEENTKEGIPNPHTLSILRPAGMTTVEFFFLTPWPQG